MKTSIDFQMPNWLWRGLLIGSGLIFVLMPVQAFISTWGGSGIGPLWLWKSWKEILILVMGLALVIWLASKPKILRELLRDKLIILVLAYTGLTLLLGAVYVNENGGAATLAAWAMNLRYLGLAAIIYVTCRFSPLDWPRLRQFSARFLMAAGAVMAVFGILQVSVLPLDFLSQFGYDKDTTIAPYTLIDENRQAPRAFATLSGPNDYAAWLILPILISLLAALKSRWLLAVSSLMLIGLYLSSSRSAWIGMFLAILALMALVYGAKIWRERKIIYSLAAAVVVGAGLLIAAVSIPSVRLQLFHSSPGDSSLLEGSTAKHFEATGKGIQQAIAEPLGCGPGCAGPASFYSGDATVSENYYVQLAREVGLIGLGLWLAIAVVVAKRLYELRNDRLAGALLASFVGLSAIGLWLHVWADDPVALTWWTLAGALLGVASRKSQKQLS